ncbi:MAG: hypothetical protein KDC95_18440 [Planctomycetes bacterium]|nr:hypothetical protein [Planctomycetota bacterium]
MAGASEDQRREEQVEEVVAALLHDPNLPKKERIRLMKELVRKGEDLPDEALELALKRLLERILF